MRFLIVEDDYASRKLLNNFLEMYGECDLAFDGLHAIDVFIENIKAQNYYDVICLDIMMPKIDGLKVLRTIRDIERKEKISSSKASKIIITSALNERKTVSESYKFGCVEYVWKPIDFDILKDTLARIGILM